MSNTTKNLIVQHNKLIQGHYKTTLQEKRLILWLMAQIKPNDKDFKKYTLKISDFAKMIGLENNHNIYKDLEKITHSLLSKVISLEIPEENKLIQLSFFSSSIYNYNEGTVEFSFDPALKPYLLELNKHYTALSLNTIIHFSSSHAIRVYELLKQYQTIGTRTIPLEEFRKFLGIDKLQYKLYASFKDRIIKFAEREINQKSDLYFEYEEIKSGKKVIAIKFIIKKNENFKKPEQYTPAPISVLNNKVIEYEDIGIDTSSEILQELVEVWGVNEQTAVKLTTSHPEYVIKAVIADVKKKLDNKKIDNAPAYLVKAIRGGWYSKSSDEIKDAINNEKAKAHIESTSDQTWKGVLEKAYRDIKISSYVSWFTQLNFKEFRNSVIYLEVDNSFCKDYIQNHYYGHIVRYWQKVTNTQDISVVFEIKKNIKSS